MAVRVVHPGVFTTVQDLGRNGYRMQGVVTGGAMDTVAHQVANWLVGNAGSLATLEVTMGGLQLFFEADTWIAVGSYGCTLLLNKEPAGCWRLLQVKAGSSLQLQYNGNGCRSYVAIRGGWEVPLLLNSRSTYLPARWGGYEGRALQKGDLLETGAAAAFAGAQPGWSVALSALPACNAHPVVRVLQGPEWKWFSKNSRQQFTTQALPVLPQSNRMGYRLQAAMQREKTQELLSTAVCPGTIQALPDGNLVLLMNDAPATGGYPRIAQVIIPDLPLCAQLVSAHTIRFETITLAQAEEIYLTYQQQLQDLQQQIIKRLHSHAN
jgi:antagonist of KipI